MYCYVDAKFSGLWNVDKTEESIGVKSHTGYVINLDVYPLVWASKLQQMVALSITKS